MLVQAEIKTWNTMVLVLQNYALLHMADDKQTIMTLQVQMTQILAVIS